MNSRNIRTRPIVVDGESEVQNLVCLPKVGYAFGSNMSQARQATHTSVPFISYFAIRYDL